MLDKFIFLGRLGANFGRSVSFLYRIIMQSFLKNRPVAIYKL